MKHARSDYDKRIVDLEGKIPEDEPVFLLRGQDPLAPKLLLMWASDLLLKGGDITMAESAMRQATRMLDWQRDHGTKTPDTYIEPRKKEARNNMINMLEEIKKDPLYYVTDSHNKKFMEYAVEFYGTSNPPVLLISRGELKKEFQDKPIDQLDIFSVDYDKINANSYRVIFLMQSDGVYIIHNTLL